MKSYNEIAEYALSCRDAYDAKQMKKKRSAVTFVLLAVICFSVLVAAVGIYKLAKPSNSDGNPVDSLTEITSDITDNISGPTGGFYIDSLDKVNYFTAKKTISEGGGISVMSYSASASGSIRFLSNEKPVGIDPASPFKVTMCGYFTATLGDKNGFLASKLGGTGQVEVVITCNDFNNLITFKKGDKYFSCFQTAMSDKTMTFSTAKYVDGFGVAENRSGENYEFIVYFERDNIIGINSGRLISSNEKYKYSIDSIKMTDSFGIVVREEKSFTIGQLEEFVSVSNPYISDGVYLDDGSILYGSGTVTDSSVALVSNSGNLSFTNEDIKKVNALSMKDYGYCIKLELVSVGNYTGQRNMKLYINDSFVRDVTVLNEGSVAYIIKIDNKALLSDIFDEFTSTDTSDRIGKIIDYNDFKRELSKKINLDDYLCIKRDSYGDSKTTRYVYNLNKGSKLESDASNYTVKIDGISITLPIKVSDLIAKGFRPDESDPLKSAFFTPQGNKFRTYTMNYGGSNDFNGRYVTQISFSCYEKSQIYLEGISPTRPDFEFIGGLNKDSTIDDLISSLGAPQTINVSFTDTGSYKNAYIQFVYNISFPGRPDGRLGFNFNPVLKIDKPSDYLESAYIHLQ